MISEPPPSQPEAAYQPLVAAFYMIGSILSFTAIAVAGRMLHAELDTFEIMMYRSLVGLAIVLVLLSTSRGGFSQIRSHRPGLHVIRNLFHFLGQNLWFFAVVVIPLSELVALEFTCPLWVALLAPFLLGEKLTGRKLIAMALGFAGILLVARPDSMHLGIGHLATLVAAVCFALNITLTRRLSRDDPMLCVLFWMCLSQAVMGALLAAPGGITLFSLTMSPWVFLVGICGIIAHYCLTSALYAAPATIVGPMEFGRLPLLMAIGTIFYNEPLHLSVILGSIIILAANLVNLRR